MLHVATYTHDAMHPIIIELSDHRRSEIRERGAFVSYNGHTQTRALVSRCEQAIIETRTLPVQTECYRRKTAIQLWYVTETILAHVLTCYLIILERGYEF